MKKHTKWMVGAFCALAFVASAFAADTNTVATVKHDSSVALRTEKVTESLFNAGELGLTLSSGYDVGAASAVNGSTLFQQPYTFNLSAGAFWFPFRNFGVEANLPFYQTKGISVDEVQFGLLARLPLAKTTPVLRNISPYVGVGGVYGWKAVEEWSYFGKVGLEVRVNKKWGIFTQGTYRNNEFDHWGQGAVGIEGGLRLVL